MVSKEQQMTPQGGLGSIRGTKSEGAGQRLETAGTMGNTAVGALFWLLSRQVLWGTQHGEHFADS